MRRRVRWLAAWAVAASVLLGTAPATGASVVITYNATLASGEARGIAATWGGGGPYRVTFRCGVPGCADFVASSTTATSVVRRVVRTTCVGETRTHRVTARDRTGASASASSRTTWMPGRAC